MPMFEESGAPIAKPVRASLCLFPPEGDDRARRCRSGIETVFPVALTMTTSEDEPDADAYEEDRPDDARENT